jgi:hypothetical protein
MIALLGPTPPEVIQRYQYMREYAWPEPVRREDGRVRQTAEEYFSGPYFDSNVLLGLISRTNYAQMTKHLRYLSLRRSDPRPETRRHSFLA